MSEYIKSLLLALLLVSGELAKNAFQPTIGTPLALIASFVMILALYAVIDHRLSALRKWKWYRRKFYKPGRFEGFYISTVSDADAPVSISKVFYDKGRDAWVHQGYGLDKDGRKIREWRAVSVYFDDKIDEWFFDGCWWNLIYSKPSREPERGATIDQLSIITTTRKSINPITSTYVDGPRHSTTASENNEVPRSGKATMYCIDSQRLFSVCGIPIRDIEDVSITAGQRIYGTIDVLINEMRNPK